MNSGDQRPFERVEDFLADESFCAFCLGTHDGSVQKWIKWLKENPQKRATANEARELFYLLNGHNTREQFTRDFQEFKSAARKMLNSGVEERKSMKVFQLPRAAIAVAATLFIMLAVGYLLKTSLWQQKKQDNLVMIDFEKGEDILPGGNRATLTLADGSVIVLDTLPTGSVSYQGKISVLKSGDGELSYRLRGATGKDSEMLNIISTPRGGQYRLVLSDGTVVWLNAASSLKYPVGFTGEERKVELTGEGYFEVAHNPSKPFIVTINGTNVKVLGTNFNINGYNDEDEQKITLLEGSVQVEAAGQTALLSPGNQAMFGFHSRKLEVLKSADLEAATAWKNGYFDLNGLDLRQMLRQISRWYNVDVEYQGIVPTLQFGGKIQRTLPLSSVVEVLKMSNVNVYINKDSTMIIRP